MKTGTTRHPKMRALARALDVPLPTAVGILQLLWEFASEFAPDGSVGKFTDEYIAEACGWSGDPSLLTKSLSDDKSRWLDPSEVFRLIIHDWPEHCEYTVHNRIARAKRFFADGSTPKLSRLAEKERKDAAAFYSESARAAVERMRQAHGTSACDVRTEQAHEPCALDVRTPRAPLPVPVPVPVPVPTAGAKAPTPMPRQSDFPKTDAAIRSSCPTADMRVVVQITESAMQTYLSVAHPKIPPLSDEVIAEAVRKAAADSPKQRGAGLFLTTVPAVIKSWAELGRHPPEGQQKSIYTKWDFNADGEPIDEFGELRER